MSEMKTLNGYEVVDGKARADIEALLARVEALEELHVTLITFTVEDKTYQAEEGMTWADWIASEYNSEMITCPECGKTVTRWVDYDGTPTYIDETVSCLGPDCTGYPAPYVCVYNSEEEIAERRPDVIPDTTDVIDPGLIYGFDREL